MYKVTEKGVEEFGSAIKLTDEDMEVLACIISESSSAPTLSKMRGAWRQSYFMDDAVEGYRIFEPSSLGKDPNEIKEGDVDK